MNKNVPFRKPSVKIGTMHMPYEMPPKPSGNSMECPEAKVNKMPTTSATPKSAKAVRNASLPSPGVAKGAKAIQKQASQKPNWNYGG